MNLLDDKNYNFYNPTVEMLKSHKKLFAQKELIVWGGDEFAELIVGYCIDNDILVNHIAVNKRYWKDHSVCGYKVEILEDVLKEIASADVLVAFRGLELKSFPKEIIGNYEIFNADLWGIVRDDLLNFEEIDFFNIYKKELALMDKLLNDEKSKEELLLFLRQKYNGTYIKNYNTNQYFDFEIIKLTEGEVFVDCGAYDGDSARAFIKNLDKQGIKTFKKIIAFEPDIINVDRLKKNLADLLDDQLTIIPKGVYSKKDVLHFNSGKMTSSKFDNEGTKEVSVDTIDNILNGEKATFIKMDVEGSEMDGLMGAKKTIKQYKPKLAICIYHKKNDFVEIPKFIHELVPEYKFFIRNYDMTSNETVLYAVI